MATLPLLIDIPNTTINCINHFFWFAKNDDGLHMKNLHTRYFQRNDKGKLFIQFW